MRPFHLKFFKLCAKLLQSLPSFSWRQVSSFIHALSKQLNRQIVHVRQGIHAIQLARTSHLKTYLAVLLIAGLAPFFEVIYKFFDKQGGDPDSYWNTYYFLHAIAPHVSALLCLSGCFLLFPKHNKLKFVLIVPCAYKFAKVLWYASISSNNGFHAFVPIGLLIIGFAISGVWFLVFNYLMNQHFHKREGIIARIRGLIHVPGLDDKERLRLLKEQEQYLKTIN